MIDIYGDRFADPTWRDGQRPSHAPVDTNFTPWYERFGEVNNFPEMMSYTSFESEMLTCKNTFIYLLTGYTVLVYFCKKTQVLINGLFKFV